jgi:hypothetical protein
MHVFVDDIHAADPRASERSSLETLRQLCGNGGWYEAMEVSKRRLGAIFHVAAARML